MCDLDIDRIVAAAAPASTAEDVPIAKAVGRVLAEPLGPALPAGLRLQARHVPALAATRRASVRVFHRLRVGVLTLADAADGADAHADIGIAGPTLAALLDGLGAAALAAPRLRGDAAALGPTLDMLLNECAVVVVAGCVSPARHRAVRDALHARGATFEPPAPCEPPAPELSVALLNGKVVIGLPVGLAEAYIAFTLRVSPLIRRLQGRSELRPPSRAARVHAGSDGAALARGHAFARATLSRSEVTIAAPARASAVDAIAWADGIVKLAQPVPAGDVAYAQYHAFDDWLH